MTDRINAFLVILEKGIREDDAESTIGALNQIKGVAGVEKCPESGSSLLIARTQIRNELTKQLISVLYPKEEG
jgi:hypothetical protein